jgi:hypothetical protein
MTDNRIVQRLENSSETRTQQTPTYANVSET